ncbi:apolipoprotein N-acyltransferase [Luteimicrobium sp. DT211]|uniref:apolipoprotein N-acyltransferase n=1 Tax=Luteimicrobium sp. DT211 TaxID=3393412 RepID=UPI003CF33C18
MPRSSPPPAPGRILSLVLAAAGGGALFLAFPDADVWGLVFVAVALLYVALQRRGTWWNGLVGLVFGLAFFPAHLWWSDVAAGVVAWLALSVASALFLGLLGVAWGLARGLRPLSRAGWWDALAFPVLFTGVEAFRSAWPWGGFPWGRLAFSQVDSPIGRLAPLGGTVLVSFVVAVVGTLLGIVTLRAVRLRLVGVVVGTAAAFVLVVAPLSVGLDVLPQAGQLKVGMVQGNVSKPGASAFDNAGEVLRNHLSGTYDLLDHVQPGDLDMVIWPENGSDYDPQQYADVGQAITEAAQAVGAPILVGAQEYPKTGGRYNVSLLWDPQKGVIDRYVKQHPVPFGEYIPLRSFVRHFSSSVEEVQTDMLPGHDPAVMTLPSARLGRDVPFSTVICFEVAYDSIVEQSVRLGSEVLVVQTNNASFGYTAESTQQLAMTRFRAMETGRAAVQASTVGVSAVVSPSGVVLQRTGLFEPAQLTADLPLRTDITPAVRAGEWPARAAAALAALLVVGGMIGSLRRARQRRRLPGER